MDKCIQCLNPILERESWIDLSPDNPFPMGRFIGGELVLYHKGDKMHENCWLFPRRENGVEQQV